MPDNFVNPDRTSRYNPEAGSMEPPLPLNESEILALLERSETESPPPHRIPSPRPWSLIALFLVTSITNLVFTGMTGTVYTFNSSVSFLTFFWIVSNAFYYMGTSVLAVWVAARSGRTSWSTWIVPHVLLIVPFIRSWDWIGFDWLSRYLLELLILVTAFRLANIGLRPVNEPHCWIRSLTITNIACIMTGSALYFVLQSAIQKYTLASEPGMSNYFAVVMNPLFVALTFANQMLMALGWVACASIFIPSRRYRWLGWLGLGFFFVGSIGLNVFNSYVVMPALEEDTSVSIPPFSIWFYLSYDLISMGLMFTLTSIIRFMGYRWDIGTRQLDSRKPRNDGDEQLQ